MCEIIKEIGYAFVAISKNGTRTISVQQCRDTGLPNRDSFDKGLACYVVEVKEKDVDTYFIEYTDGPTYKVWAKHKEGLSVVYLDQSLYTEITKAILELRHQMNLHVIGYHLSEGIQRP
jgi:hypothetical protein